jgi:hypothetical protein
MSFVLFGSSDQTGHCNLLIDERSRGEMTYKFFSQNSTFYSLVYLMVYCHEAMEMFLKYSNLRLLTSYPQLPVFDHFWSPF